MSRTIKVFGVIVWPTLRARVAKLEARVDKVDQAAGNVITHLKTELNAVAERVEAHAAVLIKSAETARPVAQGPKRRRQR